MGTVGNRLGHLRLQAFGKRVVALTGNDSEDVDVMHVVTKDIGIHPLATLVDTQAQATPDLLALADIVAALLQGADLEHIWVVPPLPQSGMGKDEPHRGSNRVTIQQQLLVLHNQLVSAHIVGGGFLAANFGIDHFALAVHRKIARVGLCGRDGLQVPEILVIANGKLHSSYDIRIFLLKHSGIFAIDRLACRIIFPVVCYFIDKEQGKHLNAFVKQLALPLDVGENRLPNLNAPQLVLVHGSNNIPGKNLDAVQKLHRVVPTVDLLDNKAVSIFLQSAGIVVKIVSDFDDAALFLRSAASHLYFELQGGGGVAFGQIDALQIKVAVGGGASRFGDTLYRDFLDQPPVVSLHSIQAEHHVIDAVAFMGGGIAQGQPWMKFFQPLSGLFTLHRLGFVNDQNRVGFSDNINGPAGTKFIQLHVNPAGILAFCIECLGIDNHHVDGAVRREAVDFSELGGVIDEKAYLFPVLLGKMLLGHLKGLIHTLPNGYAGNHHNKLAPAVVLVQLEHGLDVSIGLAHAGLHLNGEIVAVGPSLQLVRRFDLICALNFVQLLQNPLVG